MSNQFERLGRLISFNLLALGCNQHLVLQLFHREYPLRALVARLAQALWLRLLLWLCVCLRRLALLDLHLLLLLLHLLLVEETRWQGWLRRVLRFARIGHVPAVFGYSKHLILLD